MASLSIPSPLLNLSSLRVLKDSYQIHLPLLKIPTADLPRTATIRMGGGPRTYPGGVSKWQWKRMQAKKAKQLLKARLCRERQIYEMRKRAELQAAISELERPWEVVDEAPNLFSVKADEQLKVLADRFQKPGGYDLWSEEDGPQLFRSPADGLPSARFFPKGAVHSVKPYGRITENSGSENELNSIEVERRGARRSRRASNRRSEGGSSGEDVRRSGVSLVRRSNEHSEGNSEEMRMSRASNANGRVGSAMNGRRGLDGGPQQRVSVGKNSRMGNGLERNGGGSYAGSNGNVSRKDSSHQGRELDDYLNALEPEWASIDNEMNRMIGYANNDGYKDSTQRLDALKSGGSNGSDSDSFYGSESEIESIKKEDAGKVSFSRNGRNFSSYQFDESSSGED